MMLALGLDSEVVSQPVGDSAFLSGDSRLLSLSASDIITSDMIMDYSFMCSINIYCPQYADLVYGWISSHEQRNMNSRIDETPF